MRYFCFGNGEKTMVILPGLSAKSVMESAAAIARQYKIFQDAFTVYVFDRRENLPARYTVCQMADDTVSAIRALGLQEIYVFGASQGGMIAMEMARKYSTLVAKLALGSTCAKVGEAEYTILAHWAQLAKQGKREALFAAFCKQVYPAAFYNRFQSFFDDIARTVSDDELSRFATLCEGSKDFDVLEKLPCFSFPVLVLASLDDAVISTEAREQMCAALQQTPAFEQHLYTDCAHAAYDTAPDYQQRLFAFFNR